MTTSSRDPLQLLNDRLATISDISAAAAVLNWDQQTYMPEGGVQGRAEQLSTLSRIAHEMLASDETGELLDSAGEPEPGSEDAATIRLTRREYERATKLPSRLVAELSRARALAEPAWARARAESDWSAFAPHLEKIIPLTLETAEALGYEDHPYDALLDIYEPGARKAPLAKMFEELKTGLVPMIHDIGSAAAEDRSAPLFGEFDEAKQEEFGKAVISDFGYDWSRGRQDRAVHPFCINFGGPGDVRITTRFDNGWLSPALFATFHEAGHAMYEQGVDPAYTRTALSGGTSMGIHESQSRLWENLVGRSRSFWSHYYPKLRETFPASLGETSLEAFYRAINDSRPSEIRVEADELTYNLHILLRFELEVALLEESISVEDIPAAWNAKMEEYLGLTPKTDAMGALQDVHWSAGLFGYFPTYTIGNVLSVQFFDTAVKERPEIPDGIERGEFDVLREWLRENIHRHGSRYDPEDLVERVTGRPLETGPYLRYLREKFGELYEPGYSRRPG
ncbi:MAG TPA: carboxypeptidase M32 [Rubrobacteraceae bacterium]|nr:carboxypeptidase M32 [Rubrobacteraceae bacterium]